MELAIGIFVILMALAVWGMLEDGIAAKVNAAFFGALEKEKAAKAPVAKKETVKKQTAKKKTSKKKAKSGKK